MGKLEIKIVLVLFVSACTVGYVFLTIRHVSSVMKIPSAGFSASSFQIKLLWVAMTALLLLLFLAELF